jgi:hypothetical protein
MKHIDKQKNKTESTGLGFFMGKSRLIPSQHRINKPIEMIKWQYKTLSYSYSYRYSKRLREGNQNGTTDERFLFIPF